MWSNSLILLLQVLLYKVIWPRIWHVHKTTNRTPQISAEANDLRKSPLPFARPVFIVAPLMSPETEVY